MNEVCRNCIRIIGFTLLLSVFSMVFPHEGSSIVFPDTVLKIYQFPSNMIPRIDGSTDDWDIMPDEYTYGTDMLLDVENDRNGKVDPDDLDVVVKIGWVKDMNRLYFLYEAYDNYWDFEDDGLHNDMFELMVDGDLSGGEFIYDEVEAENGNIRRIVKKNSHAQNYHICTPAVGKSTAMVWNCPSWLNKMPYMNCVCSYDFKHGESGKLIMECWITPFDIISFDGPESSVESRLTENDIIGLSWLIADWDGPGKRHALPSLSHTVLQVHNASYLRAFKLMPLDEQFLKKFEAHYTFKILDNDERVAAFSDRSYGDISSWTWDFGDGTTSNEQNPVHRFEKDGYLGAHTVKLTITGSGETSSYTTLMEVIFK